MRTTINLDDKTAKKLDKYSAICGYSKSQYIALLINKNVPMLMPPHRFYKLMSYLETIMTNATERTKGNKEIVELCEEIEQWSYDFKYEMVAPKEVE